MGRIADEVGIPKPTVQGIIKRIRENDTPLPEKSKSGGAPKKLDARDLKCLEEIARNEPFGSYERIIAQLKIHQIDITKNTLARYLKQIGFGSYFAVLKPILKEADKNRRLCWAKERVDWTTQQWNGVVWSDEARFTVENNDKGIKAFREVDMTKQGNGTVILCGCFWADGFGPLVFTDSTVDETTYFNNLASKFPPWFTELCEKENKKFILQLNSSFNTGGSTTWWENNDSISRFEFLPIKSLDLNPLELIWSLFDVLISDKRARINDVNDLKICLQEAWNKISVDLAARLAESMKGRCQAIIDAKGGPIRI